MPNDASSTLPKAILHTLSQPSGARFYRCALQVNPFEYMERHKTTTSFTDEEAYKKAIVAAFQKEEVEVAPALGCDVLGLPAHSL